MAKVGKPDPKKKALQQDGALNPHPEAVRAPLFAGNPFFDPNDLLQVRYEMVRSHKIDGVGVSDAAAKFGVSRPTFYKAESALDAAGLVGLLPGQRGPKGGHKISPDVLAFTIDLKAQNPQLTTLQCLAAIESRFGVKAHRRSLERALTRKKKRLDQP
jgi:transposase